MVWEGGRGVWEICGLMRNVYLGNIVIIGLLVAVYVGYSAYRQKNQGGGVTGGLKRS